MSADSSRRCTRGPSVPAARGWSVSLACAALALSACASDGGDEVSLPPPGDLDEVRQLKLSEFALASRSATCKRTRTVVIVAGRPRPRELRLGEGACLLWGNASNTPVVATFARRPGSPMRGTEAIVQLSARSASPARGPLALLSRREAFEVSGGAARSFASGTSGTSEHATLAFSPDRRRPRRLRCPSPTLHTPPAKTPLKLPYTIEPGGAKGTIILDRPHRNARKPARRPPRGLEEITSLACGKLTLAERPAGCRVTRALVIVGRKPRPGELRLPRGGSCVVWGNRDRSHVTVSFDKRPPPGAVIVYRRLWPKAAATWDFFSGLPAGRISYTVKPGDAKGTIVLE